MKYPFHYEIRFQIINWDGSESSKVNKITQTFKNQNPLIAREQAIEAFEEYVNNLRVNNRIRKCKYGRTESIMRPESISRILDMLWENVMNEQPEKMMENYNYYEKIKTQYSEYIRLYLIIEDPDTADHLETIHSTSHKTPELEHLIHNVSTNTLEEEQDIADNLDQIEVPLYRLNDIDIEDRIETIFHFDHDYRDSVEIDDNGTVIAANGARRVILPIPKKWATKEEYLEKWQQNSELEPHLSKDQNPELLKKIIEGGENDSVEFKPSLRYDFHKKRQSYKITYINAKAICGFLNSKGGNLIIGVRDNKEILGLDRDFNEIGSDLSDSLLIQVDSLITSFFSAAIKPNISAKIVCLEGLKVLWVKVNKSDLPIFLNKMNKSPEGERSFEKEFYVRMNASTHCIRDIEEIAKYIFNRVNKLD